MKKIQILSLIAIGLLFTSCATITGTTNYTAKVIVEDNPDVAIIVDNDVKGYGEAMFKWKRANADKLSITLSEDGFKKETIHYNRNNFRTLPFLGNLILGGIPGFIVDVLTGAVYEPDETEPGITKQTTDVFLYRLKYKREAINKEE